MEASQSFGVLHAVGEPPNSTQHPMLLEPEVESRLSEVEQMG